MPTRREAMSNLIADLDSLIEEKVVFRLHGNQHFISPISTLEFFKFAERLAVLNSLRDKENIKGDELVNSYYEVISSVCPSISIEDVEKCTSAQVGALFQLVLDKVMGRLTDEKKKLLMIDPTQLLKK
jgi:hypothetical protein